MSRARTERPTVRPSRASAQRHTANPRSIRGERVRRPPAGRGRVGVYLAAGVVTAVVLAPLAAPGYVLLYDMVFVPRQPLSWALIAPTDSLPRAVPLDAVVSLVSQAVPGWLLQRLVLAGSIFAAAVGAGRLAPAERPLTRVIAAVGYAWTPYLAERLLIGQWGLLIAYAALPWIVRAALDIRLGRPGALPRLVIAAAPAAITPTGGLLALATTLVLMPWRGGSRRAALGGGGGVALLNAPWVLAGVLTTAGGASDPAGVEAFAARGENWSGALGALAGTGGIWNAQATPASRSSPIIPLVMLGLLALAGLGFMVLRRRLPPGSAARLGLLAAGAFALAALGALPGIDGGLRWLVVHVPGAGLLRDGQKFLAPYALLLVLCFALGVERLAARLEPTLAGVVLVGAVLAPIAVLPDLAVGGAGRLRPVHYPREWQVVAERIADDPGEVLSVPFSAYRSYRWNPGRVVLDPLPRFVAGDVIIDDTLYVGDVAVAGESRRVAQVRQLLAEGRPVVQAGVRWVVVQHGSAGDVDPRSLIGLDLVHDGPSLTLYRNPGVRPHLVPAEIRAARWAVAGAMAAAVLLVLIATGAVLRNRLPRGNVPPR